MIRPPNQGHRAACLAALGIALLSCTTAPAAVYVNPGATGAGDGTSWAQAYTNLQDALTAHAAEDIWVAAGIYRPGPAATNSFDLRDNILYGGFAGTEEAAAQRDWIANPTILEGDLGGGIQAKSVVRKSSAGSAGLDGFTIRNGRSIGTTEDGAGLHMSAGALTLANSQFTNNVCGRSGGALYLNGGTAVITNCAFRNNNNKGNVGTTSGGAIFVDNDMTGFALHNSTFSDNESDYTAGDVRVGSAAMPIAVTITDCTFDNSLAPNEAGSLYLTSTGVNTLRGLVFRGVRTTVNSAAGTRGGAVMLAAGQTNILEACHFENVTLAGRIGGGAVAIATGTVRIADCTFTNVAATYSGAQGGAVYLLAAADNATVTITNCSFDTVSCGSGAPGGAIAIAARSGNVAVSGSTFQNVTGGTSGGAISTSATAQNTFEQLLFRNIRTLGAGTTDAGGVLHAAGGGETIVRNCTFADVSCAGRSAGAIYLGAGVARIMDSVFTNVATSYTSVGYGGAIYAVNTTTNEFRNLTFTDITLAGSGSGGAIHINDGATTVADCAFQRTTCTSATGDSGAIFIAVGGANAGPVVITNCTFDTVAAGSGAVHGGAIQVAARPHDVTITDCSFTNIVTGGSGGAIYLAATERNTLRNCTFADVRTTATSAYSGGAVFLLAGTVNRIEGCTFEDVTLAGSGDGGAVYITTGAVELIDSTFRRTGGVGTGRDGGAVYVGGIVAEPVTVSHCWFESSEAGATARGGALYLAGRAEPVLIADSTFRACASGYDGGAVYAAAPSTPQERTVARCDFEANTVDALTYDGGALFVANGTAESRITDCTFTSNQVSTTGQGGAVYLATGLMEFEGNVFRGNRAQDGGALYQTTAQAVGITNAVTRCDFIDNRAEGGNGGALYLTGDSALSNVLFARNAQTGGAMGGGAVCIVAAGRHTSITHATFEGNSAVPAGGAMNLETGMASVRNSIFHNNTVSTPARDPSDDIHIDAADTLNLAFTIVDRNRIWAEGTLVETAGVFAADPALHDVLGDDWHPRSPFGRWNGHAWDYTDTVLSPALDTADPTNPFDQEPIPNGGRANLGRYGNTAEASKSAFAGLIVINRVPLNITGTQATLRGELKSRDVAPTAAYLCWGAADAGTNIAAWQHQELGNLDAPLGVFTANVNALAADQTYYYRAYATNAAGEAWAHATESFITGGLTVAVTDADGNEEEPHPVAFTVSRPAGSTQAAVTVNYTLAGTASPGLDYLTPSGNVTIPAGETSASVVIVVRDDTLVETQETVVLTLLPGAYALGTPASAQATLADNDSLDGFAHRMQITFHRYTQTETLHNFPALVKLNENVAFFRYHQLADPAAADLRFANSNLTEALSYEIETWNPAGDSYVWVRVPELKRNATIWALWGRADATQPAYTTNGTTWSAQYETVWHLDEAATASATNIGLYADAAAHGHVGNQFGSASAAAKVSIGQSVTGGSSIVFPSLTWAPKTYSVDFWIRPNTRVANGQAIGGVTGWGGFNFITAANGTVYAGTDTGANRLTAPADTLTLNEWQRYAFTFDHGWGRLYRNGILIQEGVDLLPPNTWGGFRFSTTVDALVDEARVSAAARSPAWVWAEWANQNDPDGFAPLGLGWPLPAIDTGMGMYDHTHHSATLDGNLLSTGGAPTRVWMHYGTTDGGDSPGAWPFSLDLGERPAGSVRTTIHGLEPLTSYFYRLRAQNAHGTVWSEKTEPFRTKINVAEIVGTNFLGDNMDFEIPGSMWYFDAHGYATSGADGIITPLSGNLMLQATGTGGGLNCDVYGNIDLGRFVDVITNANVIFLFTVHYNRVGEVFPANPIVDTMAFATAAFYDAATNLITWYGWDPTFVNTLTADNDPLTWQQASLTNVVPPNATQARIRLAWSENVRDEVANEFLGHYYDDTRFALIVESDVPQPRSGMLMLLK